MKIKMLFVVTSVLAMMTTLPAWAGKSSVEQGRQLFNDPGLGGSPNDKSCSSCHPGGEGLEKVGEQKNLSKIINRCIIGPMAGQKIDGRSVEMLSLKMYIESLARK